jgi:hypothetical protein
MAHGINIAEECHIDVIRYPIDVDTLAGAACAIVNTGLYGHVTFIIALGVTGAATTITLAEDANATPGGGTPIDFAYYSCTVDSSDVLGARQFTAAAAGFATSANDNVFYVIEVDCNQMTDGFHYLELRQSDPGAQTFGCVIAIMSGMRYTQPQSPTVEV